MIALFLLLFASFAQGEDRNKASDWPVHASLEKVELGAEYMVHAVTHGEEYAVVRDYLVVEVALYPVKPNRIEVSHQHFTLRINGKKSAIFPQSPGMVAAGMKYDDWERRPGVEASAGVDNTGIILGRPRNTERFPGDPRPGQQRLPKPPTAPQPEDRSGVEKAPKKSPDELVTYVALEEGFTPKPVRGYLYYAFKGKPSSVKSVELVYRGPDGESVLKLK